MEEQPCPPPTANAAPSSGGPPTPARGPGTSRPPWVARAAADQQILGGTDVVLPVTNAVTEGNALVVTMMLTATVAPARSR
ncbi:hypothetical protein ACFSNO_27925 [Streptomyces cirratus]